MPRTRKPAAAKHSDAQIMQFTGQQYGAQAKQIAAQRAVPAVPSTPTPSGPAAPASPAPAAGPDPGSLGDLFAPSTRPEEPLTAGMPFGPGPGTEAVRANPADHDDDLDQLRAVYMVRPSPALRDLIEFITSGRA